MGKFMKKKVKIKFLGFWDGFDEKDNIFINILKERYDVELSDNPDYLFFSPICEYYCYARYDCVRIMFTGEPYSADWNSADYAIDFDEYTFGDRHMRYPLYLCQHKKKGPGISRKKLTSEEADRILSGKKSFCNFIYGHQTVDGNREAIFEEISKYKRVDSIGRFRINMPNGEIAVFSGENANKQDYLKTYKFTIAVESMRQSGFTTEKIKDALDAYSVPVYYGNPQVASEFNPKAFVNLNDFETFEDGVQYLKRIDADDSLYKCMLMEEEYSDPGYPEQKYAELEQFLYHIFDQDKEQAYRRNRHFIGGQYNAMEKYMSVHFQNPVLKFFFLVYNFIFNRKGREQ